MLLQKIPVDGMRMGGPMDARAEAALKSQLIRDGIRIAKDKNKSHLPN
jgi:hypothetical protein